MKRAFALVGILLINSMSIQAGTNQQQSSKQCITNYMQTAKLPFEQSIWKCASKACPSTPGATRKTCLDNYIQQSIASNFNLCVNSCTSSNNRGFGQCNMMCASIACPRTPVDKKNACLKSYQPSNPCIANCLEAIPNSDFEGCTAHCAYAACPPSASACVFNYIQQNTASNFNLCVNSCLSGRNDGSAWCAENCAINACPLTPANTRQKCRNSYMKQNS